MTPFQASAVITSFVSFAFSVVIVLGGKRDQGGGPWAITTTLLAIWSLGLFGVVSSTNSSFALVWQYILDAAAILIPVGFFQFVINLLDIKKEQQAQSKIIYGLGFLVFALSFSHLFKEGVSLREGLGYWIAPGPLYAVFPLFFVIAVSYSLLLLVRGYKKTGDNLLKRRIVYVLAAQIFGFGGGVTNFLPQIFNVYPFGNYFIILYVFFISYSIFKHGLFDLKVAATEFFVFAIWIFMFVRILLPEAVAGRMFDIGIFFGLFIFGILLTRSVRKEVEAKDRLQKISSELKNTNDKLNELSRFKTQLISLVSHQFKSPLAAMKGHAQLIQQGLYGPVSDKIKEVAHKIEKSSDNLVELVGTLLDLRKVEEGKMDYVFSVVDLSEMAESIVEELSPLSSERGLELSFSGPKAILVRADKSKLRQVLQNMTDNAIKYTPKGYVKVMLRTEGGKAYLSVRDSGYGISPALLPHLFEEFVRDTKVKELVRGTGLGLYIAKRIIEAHGGNISATSEGEGKGSTFTMTIPVVG